MKVRNTLKATMVATVFAVLFAAEAQAASAASAPRYVRVRGITHAGSGCPAGSVALNFSADRQGATLHFDQFVAEVGPGVPFSQKRKNCQLNLDLDFPSGWSYAVKSMTHRGYVSLDRGVKATQQVSLYFQGQGSTATLKSIVTGPRSENYTIRDELGMNGLVWSPCGAQRSLNINTQVILDNSANTRGHGFISVDAGEGDLPSGVSDLAIVWSRCR